MVRRRYWIERLTKAWERRSVLWLAGVRRAGKTVLCQSLDNVEYFDCELPRTRRLMEAPQGFLEELRGRRIVLDEVHRLPNPSELLKIAADHFPETQVLATGSSTLEATAKFRDTLAGRKETVWLTPMLLPDLEDFRRRNLTHRFLRGGLPPFFLADELPERDFQEWMDAYWAKDIQELFRLERRSSFQRFAELLFAQSGGLFEATRFAASCEVSRQTIMNYLGALEATFVVHVVRPYSTHKPTEIVAAPKVYAFDTGFVCYHRGWVTLRPDDMGLLWEHVVLNEIQGRLQHRALRYWRNKRGAEIDFVLPRRGRGDPIAVECRWTTASFHESCLLAFRRLYPKGESFVVARDVEQSFVRTYNGLRVRFVSLEGLIAQLSGEPLAAA
ncbi:MAG: AAA family ATPase [Luteitalea sp.]|nr:AAA family ATPase [Luteitalea sp.]